jgi:hypothetical protein
VRASPVFLQKQVNSHVVRYQESIDTYCHIQTLVQLKAAKKWMNNPCYHQSHKQQIKVKWQVHCNEGHTCRLCIYIRSGRCHLTRRGDTGYSMFLEKCTLQIFRPFCKANALGMPDWPLLLQQKNDELWKPTAQIWLSGQTCKIIACNHETHIPHIQSRY